MEKLRKFQHWAKKNFPIKKFSRFSTKAISNAEFVPLCLIISLLDYVIPLYALFMQFKLLTKF